MKFSPLSLAFTFTAAAAADSSASASDANTSASLRGYDNGNVGSSTPIRLLRPDLPAQASMPDLPSEAQDNANGNGKESGRPFATATGPTITTTSTTTTTTTSTTTTTTTANGASVLAKSEGALALEDLTWPPTCSLTPEECKASFCSGLKTVLEENLCPADAADCEVAVTCEPEVITRARKLGALETEMIQRALQTLRLCHSLFHSILHVQTLTAATSQLKTLPTLWRKTTLYSLDLMLKPFLLS